MANSPKDHIEPYIPGALAKAIRKAISPARIVKVLHDGLDATETRVGFADGQAIYSEPLVDHKERREMAKLAAQLGGMADDGALQDNTIKVVIERIG